MRSGCVSPHCFGLVTLMCKADHSTGFMEWARGGGCRTLGHRDVGDTSVCGFAEIYLALLDTSGMEEKQHAESEASKDATGIR